MSRFGRRDFLKIGALAAGAAACRGGIIRTAPIFRTGADLTAGAATNYQESLKALRRTGVNPAGAEAAESGTGRLSLGPDELRAHRDSRPGQPDFDVLIIGSGYGGAVCAARLAAHRKRGVKIAVLERGREWVPGTFPFSLTNFSPFSRQSSWLRQRLSTQPARALRLSQPGGRDSRHRQRPGRHIPDQLRRRHRDRGGGVPAARVARGAPFEGAPAALLRPGPAHTGAAADARGIASRPS